MQLLPRYDGQTARMHSRCLAGVAAYRRYRKSARRGADSRSARRNQGDRLCLVDGHPRRQRSLAGVAAGRS